MAGNVPGQCIAMEHECPRAREVNTGPGIVLILTPALAHNTIIRKTALNILSILCFVLNLLSRFPVAKKIL